MYRCQTCGYVAPRWMGKCPGCDSWNTLEEEALVAESQKARGRGSQGPRKAGQAQRITEVDAEDARRISLKLPELDRVLGGGVVPGSLVLLGGEPGIGKSTLLLTCAHQLARLGCRVLYVSAEESLSQTRLRAERLNALHDDLFLLSETSMDVVEKEIQKVKPQALIVDSVQTVYVPALESAPGTVAQIREVTARVMHLAKGKGLSTFIVGHVTKDGNIAGPKMLEHMVDTVLYFEGTRHGTYRILRAHKNRFGSTNEIGVFDMQGAGLMEVPNPSAFFLAERPEGKPGSMVTAAMEGTRPVLVEIQGLCVTTAFAHPKRTTLGVDATRIALLAAVLERSTGLSLAGQDLFVNVAGGVSLNEPAADLPVVLAMASSMQNRVLPADMIAVGEVGLSGEIRGVPRMESRLQEAAKMGFKQVLLPKTSAQKVEVPDGIELLPVATLEEALDLVGAQ